MHDLFMKKYGNETGILLLGFGREGRSAFKWISEHFSNLSIGIADKNRKVANDPIIKNHVATLFLGKNYLEATKRYQIIMHSPGVFIPAESVKGKTVLTQTDLFLQKFHHQIIGVTGTKGKSSTCSLIAHFLKYNEKKCILLGNIGVPPFDKIHEIDKNTTIVFELSAHQLRSVHHAPHIGVLLNIFPEHLDFFESFEAYRRAKYNLFKYQKPNDFAIDGSSFHSDNLTETGLQKIAKKFLGQKVDITAIKKKSLLQGNHNIYNILMAISAVQKAGLTPAQCIDTIPLFQPLPHRMECIGTFKGITFYNDSISTVPQSTMAAVNSLPNVNALILGGFDRGLDYTNLVHFLISSKISHFIFMGKAGEKMYRLMQDTSKNKSLTKVKNLTEAMHIIQQIKSVQTCLLSPAAASYDAFHNFEHRGDTFRQLVKELYSA